MTGVGGLTSFGQAAFVGLGITPDDLTVIQNLRFFGGYRDMAAVILRGELDAAEGLLEKAVAFARQRKHQWYTVQPMRNLARCYLAQGRIKKAITQANETIAFSHEIGDKHYANMAGLVLAEGFLTKGLVEECENALAVIEDEGHHLRLFPIECHHHRRGAL